MTTQAKIESNRRNARRSTGPRTRDGKAASARNSLRHGLLSKQIIFPDDDIQAFTSFRQNMLADLAPDGALEENLAQRIIVNAWRHDQAVQMVTAVIAHRTTEAEAELTESRRPGDPLALGLIRDAGGADALSKLGRYERALERSVDRTRHELERLQAQRRGDDVPVPAVLDVQVSSGG